MLPDTCRPAEWEHEVDWQKLLYGDWKHQSEDEPFHVEAVAHAWIDRRAFRQGWEKGRDPLTVKAVRAVLGSDESVRCARVRQVIGEEGWQRVVRAIMRWK